MEANKESNIMAGKQDVLIQNTIRSLVRIVDRDISHTDGPASGDDSVSVLAWPSKKEIGNLFDFIAHYVSCGRANISKSVLNQIFEYLTLIDNAPQAVSSTETLKRREKQLLALLEVVPETDWNESFVLHQCENAHFYQVCGLIHSIRHQYLDALDSYMKDLNEPIHAFSFISNALLRLKDKDFAAFRSATTSRIPHLVDLSRQDTFFLVVDHFFNESSHILSELRSYPKSLFLYLKTAIEVHLSGTLNFPYVKKDDNVDVSNGRRVKDQAEELKAYLERISEFPKLLRSNPVNVTDDMIELYLELLCQYERNAVLKFLETFDSYRVEHCLRVCQEYGIIDAAAFLLEWVDKVGSALLLTLSSLQDKFVELDAAVASVVSTVSSSKSTAMEQFNSVLTRTENIW
ncbi:Clathrin domain-containing protein [Cephalotus follicularis]|uniref:Clathrin domain-containing protein n=1 Tax=Cephalotus follicularis TaxID=3775 RepID=A0A1Q3CYK8_CEPFO|nr:Clathrin domain-containing protein [Cephalotus follicularis]